MAYVFNASHQRDTRLFLLFRLLLIDLLKATSWRERRPFEVIVEITIHPNQDLSFRQLTEISTALIHPNSIDCFQVVLKFENEKAVTVGNGFIISVGAEGFEPPTLCL